jgi:hypothetical protein
VYLYLRYIMCVCGGGGGGGGGGFCRGNFINEVQSQNRRLKGKNRDTTLIAKMPSTSCVFYMYYFSVWIPIWKFWYPHSSMDTMGKF